MDKKILQGARKKRSLAKKKKKKAIKVMADTLACNNGNQES